MINVVQQTQKRDETWALGAAVVSWLMIGSVIIGCSLLLSTYLTSPGRDSTFQTQRAQMPVQLLCTCPYGCRVQAFGPCTQQANPTAQSSPAFMAFGESTVLVLCPGTNGQELIAMAPNVSITPRQGRIDGLCLAPSGAYTWPTLLTQYANIVTQVGTLLPANVSLAVPVNLVNPSMVLRETRTTTLAGITTRVLTYTTQSLAPFDYNVALFPLAGGFKRFGMAITLDTALFVNEEVRGSSLSLLSMMGGLATLIIKVYRTGIMRLARAVRTKFVVVHRAADVGMTSRV
jgi:hypothetical protein